MKTHGLVTAFIVLAFQACIEVHALGEQYANIYCHVNDTTQTIIGTFLVYKNGTDVSNVSFVDNNNGIYTEYGESACQWSGSGSASDPYKIMVGVDYDTDTTTTGYGNCGMNVVQTGEEYEWLVLAQREFPYIQEGDELFRYTCRVSDRLPTNFTIGVTVEGYDALVDISPSGGLLSLGLVSSPTDNTPVSIKTVGEDMHVLLKFQPDNIARPNTDDSLRPWGAYCEKLYVQNSDASRSADILDPNTCPRNDFSFLRPSAGFIGTTPNANGLFSSYTGAIAAARFDRPSSNSVTFVCHAKLCWIPNDQLCLNSCSKLSSKRKKRTELIRKLSATVYITDDGEVQENKRDEEDGISWYVWAIVGVLGTVVLITVVGITVCVIRRMKPKNYKRYPDPSASIDSTYSYKY